MDDKHSINLGCQTCEIARALARLYNNIEIDAIANIHEQPTTPQKYIMYINIQNQTECNATIEVTNKLKENYIIKYYMI